MNPKKAKEISKQTAKDLDLDPVMVEDIVSFFWNDVQKTLTDLEHPRIEIHNFGTFKVKPWMLGGTLEKYKHQLSGESPVTFSRMQRYKAIESRSEKVKAMIKIFDKESEKKRQFQLKKNAQTK